MFNINIAIIQSSRPAKFIIAQRIGLNRHLPTLLQVFKNQNLILGRSEGLKLMDSRIPVLMIGKKNIRSYVLDVVMLFNQGMDKVVIIGRGPSISKAVNVYNALKARLGDALQLDGVEIGSEVRGHRLVSFIKITISRK